MWGIAFAEGATGKGLSHKSYMPKGFEGVESTPLQAAERRSWRALPACALDDGVKAFGLRLHAEAAQTKY